MDHLCRKYMCRCRLVKLLHPVSQQEYRVVINLTSRDITLKSNYNWKMLKMMNSTHFFDMGYY